MHWAYSFPSRGAIIIDTGVEGDQPVQVVRFGTSGVAAVTSVKMDSELPGRRTRFASRELLVLYC